MPKYAPRTGVVRLVRGWIIPESDPNAGEWGVFVNGQRIDRPQPLKTGDILGIPDDPAHFEVRLEHLALDWRARVSAAAPGVDLDAVEVAIVKYICARSDFVHAVPVREVVHALRVAETGLATLMQAIDDFGAASLIARDRMAQAEAPSLDWDELYPIITRLRRRAYLALAQEGRGADAGKQAFYALVANLADAWIAANKGRPTAAKFGRGGNAARTSPFVKFVQAALLCVPAHLREHKQSLPALSAEVSDALRPRRRDFSDGTGPKQVPPRALTRN